MKMRCRRNSASTRPRPKEQKRAEGRENAKKLVQEICVEEPRATRPTGAESRETARDIHNEISPHKRPQRLWWDGDDAAAADDDDKVPPNGKRRYEVNLESPDVGPNAHRGHKVTRGWT